MRKYFVFYKFNGKFELTVSFYLLFEFMNKSEKAFNALGDPTRRLIFEKLQTKPLAVVDIADGLLVSRPAVSQHLKILKEAKLINISSLGTKNIYEINREGILAMRDYLDKFWDDALSNFKTLAEQTERTNNEK